jgi:hypothetical protein
MIRRSKAVRLLGLRVRMRPGACIFLSLENMCCISGGLCDGPIPRSGVLPSACVFVCVCLSVIGVTVTLYTYNE